MSILKKTISSVDKNVEKLESLYVADEHIKWYKLCWKTVWQFLKILNIELPYDQTRNVIPRYLSWRPETYPYRNLHTDVHNSIIYNSQIVETTKCP